MAPVAILRLVLLLLLGVVVVVALLSVVASAQPSGHSDAVECFESLSVDGQEFVSGPLITLSQLPAPEGALIGDGAPQWDVSYWAPGPTWRDASGERRRERD